MTGAGVLVGVPGRRAVRVDMAAHVAQHADEIGAAVRRYRRLSPAARGRWARDVAAGFASERARFGLGCGVTDLLAVQVPGARVQQAKLAKNETVTAGLTLQSAGGCRVVVDGVPTVLHTCPNAGACTLVCVLGHGRGEWLRVKAARDWRTFCLWSDPVGFAVRVRWELERAAARHGRLLVRLNVNSDIPWHLVPEVFAVRGVRAYDYTKDPDVLAGDGWALPNYRRVFSWSERADGAAVARFLARGGTVAMVTDRAKGAPTVDRVRIGGRWWPVVDGDQSDDRYSDPAGAVVDLYAKGRAVRASGARARLVAPVYSGGADVLSPARRAGAAS